MDNSASILIVDDNPENLKVISNILRDEGYLLSLALDGQSAFKILSEIKVDLILLDIMMPGMDGYEVCLKIKGNKAFQDIPVIFLSALNSTEDIVKAFDSGAVDYITKPFQALEVKARVATHIRLRLQNLELVELNSSKDRLMSIIAHDLRNPFNHLIGLTELIINRFEELELPRIKEMITMVNDSSNNTYNLLNDLLIWSKSQSGKLPFEPHKTDLKRIIFDTMNNLELSSKVKNIAIRFVEDRIPDVFADEIMLETVIRNIISNAIKFTRTNGKIFVYVENDARFVTITVSDNGVGIDKESLSNIWDFTRHYSTIGTAKEKGTGFGLQLCKDFVEKNGGTIWVDSELGKGSDFKFTVPVYKE
jgi:signal transduction histidine kinase